MWRTMDRPSPLPLTSCTRPVLTRWKRSKIFALLVARNADPLIAHRDDDAVAVAAQGDGDVRLAVRILDGVVEQVG